MLSGACDVMANISRLCFLLSFFLFPTQARNANGNQAQQYGQYGQQNGPPAYPQAQYGQQDGPPAYPQSDGAAGAPPAYPTGYAAPN